MGYTLCLIRHGQSRWNEENRFTGWTDVDLTDRGIKQAIRAGNMLKAHGYAFDVAYTSVLKRAIRTLWHVLDQMDELYIQDHKLWRLNERHYGALQGLNKAETAKKYGDAQVKVWRRSYATPPDALDAEDPRHPKHDPRYKDVPAQELPATESLKTTLGRFLPAWHQDIAPAIKRGERIIIAAHGNSLRALIKHLDQVGDDDIVNLEIPVGMPLIYELDNDLKPIKHYYLGDAGAEMRSMAFLSDGPLLQLLSRRLIDAGTCDIDKAWLLTSVQAGNGNGNGVGKHPASVAPVDETSAPSAGHYFLKHSADVAEAMASAEFVLLAAGQPETQELLPQLHDTLSPDKHVVIAVLDKDADVDLAKLEGSLGIKQRTLAVKLQAEESQEPMEVLTLGAATSEDASLVATIFEAAICRRALVKQPQAGQKQ